MSGLIGRLLAKTGGNDAPTRIALSDIESRVRDLTTGTMQSVEEAKSRVVLGGILGGVAVVAGAFFLGRRRGRKRATILEIRKA